MSETKKEGYSLTVVYNGITYYIGKGCDCVLPVASETTLGGIKVGLNLSIDENGVLSATDTTYTDATEDKSGLMSASDKTKLNALPQDAEPNQNAFSKVIAGSDAIESTNETDTFSLEGSNISITGSPASKKITFTLSKQGVLNALGYTPVETDTNTSHYHGVGVGLLGSGGDGVSGGTYTYKLNLQSETLDVNNALVRPSSNANRFYPLLVDKSGNLATIVPWTDTIYTLPVATSGALGGVKIGYTTSGKNYAVELDENNRMFVSVPWSDTSYSLPTMSATTKGGAKLGDNLKVENDTLDVDTSKIATKASVDTKVEQDTFDTYTNTTAPNTYAKQSDLDDKVSKSGDTMTGKLTAPYIETGSNANNYFQCQKFRGQGNASTYNHAIDFGYSGHDRVDFYEYGGVFNFWRNSQSTATSAPANRVISLQVGKILERGNTLTYPGKSGTFALIEDLTDFITASALTDYAKTSAIPTDNAELTNGANYITKAVSDLTNYYNIESINSIVATLKKNSYQTITDKPTTGEEGITYLVGSEAPYEMWVYETTEGWIYLGKSTIDLDGYVTGQDLTSNMLILGSGGTGIKSSNISIVTTLGSDNTTMATSLAVKTAIENAVSPLQSAINTNTSDISSIKQNYALKTEIPTYTIATTTANGLMSSDDKSKLDKIESGANNYTLPTATDSALGGIQIGYSENNKNYAIKLDTNGKAYVSVPWTDTTYTLPKATTTTLGGIIVGDNLTIDSNGKLSAIQGTYTLPVATSSALGGVKIGYTTSGQNYAVQLDSNNKMYVNVPWVNTTYTFTPNNPTLAWGTTSTIGTIGGQTFKITMPSNPNTDTHWTTMAYIGAKDSKSNGATTNGNTYLKVYDNSTIRSQFQIKGSGATSVISDSSGNVEIKTPIDNSTITSGSNGLESHPVKISVDTSTRFITLNIL